MRKFRIVKMIVIGAIAITAFAYVVMLLWNGLIPALFHGPIISFGQAIGLLILAKVFFGGFRSCGGKHHWRARMQEKMNAMTPEEREKFREQWRKRCGRFGSWDQQAPDASETKAD